MLSLLRTAFRLLTDSNYNNLNYFFLNSGLFLLYFIIAKILMRDRKLCLKESLYIMLGSLLCALVHVVYVASITSEYPSATIFSAYLFYRVFFLLSLFLYFYKLKSYPVKKAVLLLVFSDLLILIARFLTNFIFSLALPLASPFLVRFFINFILGVSFAFLFVKTSGKVRNTLNANTRLLAVCFWGSFITWASFQVMSILASFSVSLDELFLTGWSTLLLLGYVATAIVSFFFYSRSLNTKLLLQRKEIEQENLQFYTSEIEQQQTAMRRFKHDYQNILNSLHSFIKEKDWDGLEQYYVSKVESASAVITQNDFALEALGKIKVREIKGILATKLLLAQNMGIDTSFEADEEIDHIPIDSVTLVRMLGIVLDNAIEAAESLDAGQLRAACLKTKTGITFIVQNNCAPDMPSLQELKQDGFSTKGPGRGQGLSILSELASSCPNVALSMSIVESTFTQKLMIGKV